MKHYFIENLEASLPIEIVAKDATKYREIIKEIHQQRIKDVRLKEHRPLLSICIPSYNRGSKAQRAVEKVLESSLDSEIEIVVSNNGSVENQEGYQNIKNMQDTRIQYSEFDSNQEYASNVAKVLSMARGRFAVLSSDEDIIFTENLRPFLKYLLANQEAGVIISSGIGSGFQILKDSCFEYGVDSLQVSLNRNYITGLTLNVDKLYQEHAFERFKAGRGNVFLEVYTHILFALYASIQRNVCHSAVILFHEEEPAPSGPPKIIEFTRLENRINQQNSAIELLNELFGKDYKLFTKLMLERMEKTYFLQYISYEHKYELFTAIRSWNEACLIMYENNKKLVDRYVENSQMKKVWYTSIRQRLFAWMDDFPCKDNMSEEEVLIQELVNKKAELQMIQEEEIKA